jgi:hypothetical protein
LPNSIPNPASNNQAAGTQPAKYSSPQQVNPAQLSEVEAALDQMAHQKFAEAREDGQWLAEFSKDSYSLRSDAQYSILHLRYGERSVVRRVLRLAEQTGERVVLEVMRFGQIKPGRLEFVKLNARKPRNRIAAESFRSRLARLLAENFPDGEIDSLTATPDSARYFSGLYIRGLMVDNGARWAFLAAPPGSNVATLNGALTYGLAWLHWAREHSPNLQFAGLRIFIPQEAVSELQHQARWLNARARTEIFALAENSDQIERCDPADIGNLLSELIPRWEIEKMLGRGQTAIQQIRELSPQSADYVAAGLELETDDVPLRFRGLEFARWTNGALQLDPRRARTRGEGDAAEMDEGGDDRLEAMAPVDREQALKNSLDELSLRRNPLASDTQDPLYRSAPERWLETLILADPSRLDATLDTRFLYSQVPAFAHSHQGIMDLVGVTRKGRVVIIELKVSEEIQLPAQGLRYWMRVKQHLDSGDFARSGYFPGIQLSKQLPALWLVAPSLHFHAATDLVLKYFSPEVEVTRIGINENWRRGIRVTFRK